MFTSNNELRINNRRNQPVLDFFDDPLFQNMAGKQRVESPPAYVTACSSAQSVACFASQNHACSQKVAGWAKAAYLERMNQKTHREKQDYTGHRYHWYVKHAPIGRRAGADKHKRVPGRSREFTANSHTKKGTSAYTMRQVVWIPGGIYAA